MTGLLILAGVGGTCLAVGLVQRWVRKERALAVEQFKVNRLSTLAGRLDREPTPEEVALDLRRSEERVALAACSGARTWFPGGDTRLSVLATQSAEETDDESFHGVQVFPVRATR